MCNEGQFCEWNLPFKINQKNNKKLLLKQKSSSSVNVKSGCPYSHSPHSLPLHSIIYSTHHTHTHLPIYPPILALLWCHRNQPHIRYDDDDNNNIHLAGGDWFKLNSFHPQFEMESISDPPVDKSALIYYYAYYSMLWLTDWPPLSTTTALVGGGWIYSGADWLRLFVRWFSFSGPRIRT